MEADKLLSGLRLGPSDNTRQTTIQVSEEEKALIMICLDATDNLLIRDGMFALAPSDIKALRLRIVSLLGRIRFNDVIGDNPQILIPNL